MTRELFRISIGAASSRRTLFFAGRFARGYCRERKLMERRDAFLYTLVRRMKASVEMDRHKAHR